MVEEALLGLYQAVCAQDKGCANESKDDHKSKTELDEMNEKGYIKNEKVPEGLTESKNS